MQAKTILSHFIGMFREKQLANYLGIRFLLYFLEYFLVCWICYVLQIVIATKTFFFKFYFANKMLTTVSGFFFFKTFARKSHDDFTI